MFCEKPWHLATNHNDLSHIQVLFKYLSLFLNEQHNIQSTSV